MNEEEIARSKEEVQAALSEAVKSARKSAEALKEAANRIEERYKDQN